ncbi:MAG: vitamin K epoxide reductase family protein [bacterium]
MTPATRRWWLAALLLAVAGIGVAGYLTWVHYAELEPFCVGGGCERVQASRYAELAGIPVALIGLLSYCAIVTALATRREAGLMLATGLALVGFGFSAYLTYLELFVIEAVCQWCAVNAVIATALAAATVGLVVREG